MAQNQQNGPGSQWSSNPPPPPVDPAVRLAARIYIAQSLAPIITIALVVIAAFWFFTRP
jgi:hypothetical protein